MDNKAKTNVPSSLKFIARSIRPTYVEDWVAAGYMKSHGISHGTYIDKHGKLRGRVIARYLINPEDTNTPHIHFYTNNIQTVKRIMNMMPTFMCPWDLRNRKRKHSTYSFGTEFDKDPKSEPVFGDWIIKLDKWSGTPSPRHVGPYWTRVPNHPTLDSDQLVEPDEPAEDMVWIAGRHVKVGAVDNYLVDSTLDLVDHMEALYQTHEVRDWAANVRNNLPRLSDRS